MAEKDEKIGLFDFTNQLTNGKQDFRKHPRFEKDYNPFMINRVLSMSPKTCHLAMFMSGNSNIPKGLHYLFFLLEIDQEKVFFNYAKRSNDIPAETLKAVQWIYQSNYSKAKEILKVLSDDQVNIIVEDYKKLKIE